MGSEYYFNAIQQVINKQIIIGLLAPILLLLAYNITYALRYISGYRIGDPKPEVPEFLKSKYILLTMGGYCFLSALMIYAHQSMGSTLTVLLTFQIALTAPMALIEGSRKLPEKSELKVTKNRKGK